MVFSAPAGNLYTSINKNGITVLPNGRLLTPAGKSLVVAPHPFGLALSRDGKISCNGQFRYITFVNFDYS